MFQKAIPKDIRQFELNYICSCLHFCKIKTTQDLNDKFYRLIAKIKQNPEIFKPEYSTEQCIQILKNAIAIYNDVNAFKINVKFEHSLAFEDARQYKSKSKLVPVTTDDLSTVTKGYDRLEIALENEQTTSTKISNILKTKEFAVVPQVIIGTGDTGTTLWLEKYKEHHGTTKNHLANGQLPSVLLIGEDSGSWKHDYTLAQRHGILERTSAKENPSIYLSSQYYSENPHANGRHLYQANQTNLGLSDAPLLRSSLLRVEKKSNHLDDWKASEQEYRLLIKTSEGIKHIYTNELNICTGLGPARNALSGEILETSEFQRLNQFDADKGFTPIVDGNQFILTNIEEQDKGQRSIVVYGGGGTAAACYRKSFFGNDIHTENKEFSKSNQKNSIIWIAKQFDKAGTGKLATTALKTANSRHELAQGELTKIEQQPNGKLILTFNSMDQNVNTLQMECDQLIYSVGQDDSVMRNICSEVETDLNLVYDEYGMVLNVSSADKKVVFFGAAAMAVREKEYMDATWKWLRSENIGGDVGPGSMPPSRAQIKRYNFLNGLNPESINANVDSKYLIIAFLEKAGVDTLSAVSFVDDLLRARLLSPSGAPHASLTALIKLHKLDNVIEVKGQGHFVLTKPDSEPKSTQQKHHLLSWINSNRQTTDASALVSAVNNKGIQDDSMEKEKQGVQLISEIRT